jgi:hypothetical protein
MAALVIYILSPCVNLGLQLGRTQSRVDGIMWAGLSSVPSVFANSFRE